MIYLMATLAGLVAGAALGFGVGFGAAELFTRAAGPREGAAAMAGFFFIGPFGLLAGFLFGFGAVLRFGGGNISIANGTLVGGGLVLTLAALLVTISVVNPTGRGGSSARSAFDFRFEVEVPKGTDLAQLRWQYFGHAPDGEIDYQFHDPVCKDDKCVVDGLMQMVDAPETRRVWIAFGSEWKQRFDIPFPGAVTQATEWTEWKEAEHGVRFRWRMEAVR